MSIEALIQANTEALIALTAALQSQPASAKSKPTKAADPAPVKPAETPVATPAVAEEKPAAPSTPDVKTVTEVTNAELAGLIGGAIKNKTFARDQAIAILKQATGAEKLGDVKPEDYVKAANAFHKAIALHATAGFPENPAEYPADKFADFLARAK